MEAVQRLEQEISRLHASFAKLQQALYGLIEREGLLSQNSELQLEVDRQQKECIQLYSVLTNQTQDLKKVASNNYGSHVHLINEVVEPMLAFEGQNKINRQLEDELQQEGKKWQAEREQLQQENEKLKEENDNQCNFLSMNLTRCPQTQTEAFMQNEIRRLTSEKLDLQEKLDLAKEEVQQCKLHLKLKAKAVKDACLLASKLNNKAETVESATQKALVKSQDQKNNVSVAIKKRVTRKNREPKKKESIYQGMFEFHKKDVQQIVWHLIFELKPCIAVTLLPELPAYILFMCIRHTDDTNDDEKLWSLLTATVNTIKKVMKERHDDIDTMVLWLTNTVRLLNNLKQYSRDRKFQTVNTRRQNEQCLRNFYLSEYKQVLSNTAVEIYQSLTGHIQEKIRPLVVPAILEHEPKQSLSSIQPLETLLQELNSIHKIMQCHSVDSEIILQIFRQIFYFICAISLNNLLLRENLCHLTKGWQIRRNLSQLEQWWCDTTRKSLPIFSIDFLKDSMEPETLQPIIQASHLLDTHNLDENVQNICDMCDKLSVVQATLLMDTKFTFPVILPFKPSKIKLEYIEVPEELDLPMLKKV
ncbi:unconventional myosin-Va-like isoform X2 [Schistocerca gregaria]|uniref:unconventional myosin-Va-like isoform X2 n=1 Tax=Schistocerca gregaria TaxID=7010 RepID=UPI00211E488C|nr:unconventional myosin-Va-like isoform X2 [Schistocerca gregaria]